MSLWVIGYLVFTLITYLETNKTAYLYEVGGFYGNF